MGSTLERGSAENGGRRGWAPARAARRRRALDRVNDTRGRWWLDRRVRTTGQLGQIRRPRPPPVRRRAAARASRAPAPAALLGDLGRDGAAVRDQPAARVQQPDQQRAALDAAVRVDARGRRDRADARHPAARPGPHGAGHDPALDGDHHRARGLRPTGACRWRSCWSCSACVASGVLSGLAITQLGITPLIATLGVNALLTGHPVPAHQRPGDGVEPARADELRRRTRRSASRTSRSWRRSPSSWWPSLIRTTIPGRRFVAVGASAAAARVGGHPRDRLRDRDLRRSRASPTAWPGS